MNTDGHLAFLLRSGPVVVFASHLDWSPIYISHNIERVFGYPVEAYFKEPKFWNLLLHPDDAERVFAELARITETGRVEVENRIVRADGVHIHIRSEITLERKEDGSPDRIVGFFLDRTRDVQQQHELESQKHQLEQANESLEQFVYVTSHDLREPLTGAAGYAALVQRRYSAKLDTQGQQFLQEIVRSCKSMEQKIDDLLELSRVGRGTPHTDFPLGLAIDQARRSLVSSIGTTGAAIRYDQLPIVRGDRGQIAQVFQNLFSNSIKYREKDTTPDIEVSVESSEDPGWWVISVRDNGIGFDMRHAERIFGVFQRLYTPEQYPGTGIGLAIAKKIVDRHGGRIWALSKPGNGATFHFTLPKPDS